MGNQRIAEEEQQCRIERTKILDEFSELRQKVGELFEINAELPEEEILPVQVCQFES